MTKKVILLSILNSLVVSICCIPIGVPSWRQWVMCGAAGFIIAWAADNKKEK